MVLSKRSFLYRWWSWTYTVRNDCPPARANRYSFAFRLLFATPLGAVTAAIVACNKFLLHLLVFSIGGYWRRSEGDWGFVDPFEGFRGLIFPLFSAPALTSLAWYFYIPFVSYILYIVSAIIALFWVFACLNYIDLSLAKHYPKSYPAFKKSLASHHLDFKDN